MSTILTRLKNYSLTLNPVYVEKLKAELAATSKFRSFSDYINQLLAEQLTQSEKKQSQFASWLNTHYQNPKPEIKRKKPFDYKDELIDYEDSIRR